MFLLKIVRKDLRYFFHQSHHLLTNDLLIVNGWEMIISLVKLSGLVKSVTKMVTGCLKTTKVALFGA